MAIVFYFMVNTKDIKNATVLIHNSYLEMWNVNKEALLDIARFNTPRLLKCTIADMNDVIKSFMYDEMSENMGFKEEAGTFEILSDNKDEKMFVLTNNLKINGAVCILYDNIVRQFALFIRSDLYIIPSSVHEVILVPVGCADKDALNSMVRQVNMEEVEKYEILSNHIYKYEIKEDRILIP